MGEEGLNKYTERLRRFLLYHSQRFEFLRAVSLRKLLYYSVNVSQKHILEVVHCEIDAVVRHPILGKVVGSYFLASFRGADLATAEFVTFSLLPASSLLIETRP